ncbi:GATA zinc finger domain-containing protein 14-like [Chrysoperla carnea]|uniref:GATA zinc finger domain-containing protein 14-like n=1 Tax=Chrysoperla carnea TaxID=189513 RepID=UPI001D08F127|nr:GATA zinc finger domain-containing protein 14-like [Chrysoperla carnea]
MKQFIITMLTTSFMVAFTYCHREHKVHNIVLYPDKQSWCKTTPIKQVVGEPGYESTTVENSVCVGTCFSYSIPHTSDITITPYCDSCQPSETHWFHVTLKKLANADEELSEYPNQDVVTPLPETIQKQIQIITNCTCLSCTEQLNNQKNFIHENTTELPKSLLANNNKKSDQKPSSIDPKIWDEIEEEAHNIKDLTQNTINDNDNDSNEDNSKSSNSPPFEIPELLQLVNRSNSRTKSTRGPNTDLFIKGANIDFQNVSAAQRYYLNTKLINLLKNIQNSSQNDSTPTENNFNFDHELLSELLAIIEGSENHLNDKNLMEFVNFVNVHNSEDFELDLSRLKNVLTKYENENKNKQFELCDNAEDDNTNVDSIEYATLNNQDATKTSVKTDAIKEDHDHNHFAGEHIDIALDDNKAHLSGHLIPGPHGSLVVQPDDTENIEEKLNIEPHQLRPNHEGTIINYESHNHKDKHKTNN